MGFLGFRRHAKNSRNTSKAEKSIGLLSTTASSTLSLVSRLLLKKSEEIKGSNDQGSDHDSLNRRSVLLQLPRANRTC